MARTNTKTRAPAGVTHEGAPAKRIGTEAQLRRTVMACLLWEGTFYEDGESVADRIAEGVAAVPLDVAAAIAIEAREVMHLRHVPLLIVREMARRGGSIVGDTLARVIQRADELAEFVAIYWRDGKEPLSAQVKRGLAEAFRKFDEYQLAKYDRAADVRLRDVLFLCHAKPKDADQEALWGRLIDGTLATPDTWEVALSATDDVSPRDRWTRLLAEDRLGGMALLRNLRNMKDAGVDPAAVRDAIRANPFRRVLPFRFIAAAKAVPAWEEVIEEAMLASLNGAPTLAGKTALVVDHSGSMRDGLSDRSVMTRFDAAAGLAILLREVCEDVVVVAFSGRGYYGLAYNRHTGRPTTDDAVVVPNRRGFALRDALEAAIPWGGTNTQAGKDVADREGYDRIVVITDEQSHTRISDPRQGRPAYFVNVGTYRNGIGYGRWTHIDGWSEAIVRYIQGIEEVGDR